MINRLNPLFPQTTLAAFLSASSSVKSAVQAIAVFGSDKAPQSSDKNGCVAFGQTSLQFLAVYSNTESPILKRGTL